MLLADRGPGRTEVRLFGTSPRPATGPLTRYIPGVDDASVTEPCHSGSMCARASGRSRSIADRSRSSFGLVEPRERDAGRTADVPPSVARLIGSAARARTSVMPWPLPSSLTSSPSSGPTRESIGRGSEGLLRGYVRCAVDDERWRADFRAVSTVLAPTSPISTLASFEVRNGEPGARPAV
jgi:hypothetical protein